MSKSKKETNLKLVKGSKNEGSKVSALSPREIVSELDRYVIGQKEAKKAVAIALRNRWRRQALEDDMKDEVLPKNILMIGPTGVGKTEISRRLSKLAEAPFVKVEATRFTEVGYVGRDVEQIVRDLIEIAQNAKPPVCKIMDMGKFKYDAQKKANKAKKKQKKVELKEIKLRPVTEIHDYSFKIKNAQKFLSKGDKVKFTIKFKGRELQHSNLGHELMDKIKTDIEKLGKVELQPKFEGKQMIMVIQPI